MTANLIYSNASIYEGVMRALYGRGYNERFSSVAELIAEVLSSGRLLRTGYVVSSISKSKGRALYWR